MTSKKQSHFDWRVRVYYEDTDAGGIVYYANYLRFFERARTEWLRALGVSHRDLAREEGLQFVVRSLVVDYRLPARLDDDLMLSLTNLKTRGASLLIEQNACRAGSEDILVSAQVRIASVRCADGSPVGMPKWLVKRVTE
ncbi:MAG: tol-pal system-associated acyl-CoA thioesterase [Burkholderiaceae bacterium]